MSFKLFVLITGLALQASPTAAWAHYVISGADVDGRRTRKEHVNSCEIGHHHCLQNIGAGTHAPSQRMQCKISYEQCLRR
jgi:hypothetical protein